MKTPLLVACLLLVVGCDNIGVPSLGPEVASTTPASFHLRDFTVKEDAGEYYTSYSGRMTLVATSEQLKTGTYLVYLEARAEHQTDPLYRASALLIDGIGEITTYHSHQKSEPKQAPKYTNWRILGYQPVHPGTATSDSTVSVAPQVRS
jgi:hypothetical protein